MHRFHHSKQSSAVTDHIIPIHRMLDHCDIRSSTRINDVILSLPNQYHQLIILRYFKYLLRRRRSLLSLLPLTLYTINTSLLLT